MAVPPPDLLCADARVRVDLAAFRQALVFAFAAGGAQQAFDDLLANASLPPSSWRRSAFARDLYVDEIVEKCLAVQIGGKAHATSARYVARVLGEPPREARDVELRRDVLSQLASSPALREELERIYLAVVRLRALLCASRQPAPRVRRVEILRVVREAFEVLAGSFAGATAGLARLREFGAAVVASEGHRRLVAFLDHDEHMGSLDLRVRVGADGEVRAMQIVAVRENHHNPFYVSVLRRLFARIALMVRGYRTTSGEVAERLLSDVFAGVEDSVALLFQLQGDAQVYLGAIGLRDRALEKGLVVALPVLAERGAPLHVEGLFNPLLLAAGVTPVPCDLTAGPDALVVVTGPNSGGKTRLLQAVAIAQLLCEAGLFAPARAGHFPRASGLFASLFEEARADQPEGHLGMELLRVRRLFDEMDAGALVVIDELCSGTNPSEGEEIARLILSLLPELGVRAFVTTHLLQFAASLAREQPTASLEFLQVELDELERPTYRFVSGVARTSLAHKTAARLGVTREELLERIEAKKRASGPIVR
jgi:DNA mismatch repair protein MutS2